MESTQVLVGDGITVSDLNAMAASSVLLNEPEVVCEDDCGCDDCDVAD